MLKHGILKNGLLNNDSVISIILNISEESVNNKRVVVNRFFTHVQDDKLKQLEYEIFIQNKQIQELTKLLQIQIERGTQQNGE